MKNPSGLSGFSEKEKKETHFAHRRAAFVRGETSQNLILDFSTFLAFRPWETNKSMALVTIIPWQGETSYYRLRVRVQHRSNLTKKVFIVVLPSNK